MQNSKTPEATPAYSYPQFTEEMRKTYKILVPNMLPVQLGLICRLMKNYGYDMELLHTEGPNIAEQGLRNVHNDTCYPAAVRPTISTCSARRWKRTATASFRSFRSTFPVWRATPASS